MRIAFILLLFIPFVSLAEKELEPENFASTIFNAAGGKEINQSLGKTLQNEVSKDESESLLKSLVTEKQKDTDLGVVMDGRTALEQLNQPPMTGKAFNDFSKSKKQVMGIQGRAAKAKAIEQAKSGARDEPLSQIYGEFMEGSKFELSENDPWLAGTQDSQLEVSKKEKPSLYVCYQSVHGAKRTCDLQRVVKVEQRPDEERLVTLHAGSQTYASHLVRANLVTGQVSIGGGVHPYTRIENPLTLLPEGASYKLVQKTISRRLWSEIGAHSHEVYYTNAHEPTVANKFIYQYSVLQGAMGSRKNRKRNQNKMRGYVDQWKFKISYPAKDLNQDVWRGCESYQSLSQTGMCRLVHEQCLDTESSKVIKGISVKRDCWTRRRTYLCKLEEDNQDCEKIKSLGCKQVDSECVSFQNGVCSLYKQTYACGGNQQRSTQTIEPENLEVSSAKPRSYHENNDFGQAVAAIEALGGASSTMVDGGPNAVFTGRCLSCHERPQQCCLQKGTWRKLIGCKPEEEELADAIRDGLCHFVAKGQVKKTITESIFHGRKQQWCCFQSKLARIVNEGVRAQLGISWGRFDEPACRGLTLDELQDPRIDWNLIDFSEVSKELGKKAKSINRQTFTSLLQKRLGDAVNPENCQNIAKFSLDKQVIEHKNSQNKLDTELSEFLGEVQK